MTTHLRQRMIEDMQLRGLAERTQEMYVIVVRQLAEHYSKSPDLITEEELRQYFLYLKNDKQYSRSTVTVALCGIKFFYEHTLQREWPTLALVRPPRERKLPVVLSREEVHRILGCLRRPYCRLRPEKLHVGPAEGSIADGPVTPRCYTLTHSDTTGDLFLTIGPAP